MKNLKIGDVIFITRASWNPYIVKEIKKDCVAFDDRDFEYEAFTKFDLKNYGFKKLCEITRKTNLKDIKGKAFLWGQTFYKISGYDEKENCLLLEDGRMIKKYLLQFENEYMAI